MEEFFKELIEKLRSIADDGKDAGELRSMIIGCANDLETMASNQEGDAVTINEDEEATFIQNHLLVKGSGIISTGDIKLVIDGQLEYLISIGAAGRIE